MIKKKHYVLQLCHGYAPPFLDVARQYAVLFEDTPYQVITVFLTGKKDPLISQQVASDEVLFLENSSQDLRGLKLRQIRQLKKIQKNWSFDFAIAHRYKSIYIACHLKDLRVIGVHHAFNDYQRLSRRLFAYRNKNKLCLIGVSNAVRDDLRNSLSHFPKEQVQTLYNHIDTEALQAKQLSRSKARQSLDLDSDCFYFVNVGRLHPDKDQRTLINAFGTLARQYENVRLIIFGKGRLEAALKAQIAQLGLMNKVVITARPCIAYYLKAFDSFVLSSDHEPFGMVLLEAMSAGLPVISTLEGGAGEIVADSGWLFKQGDSEHLSKLMQYVYTLVSNTGRAQNMHELVQCQQKMSQRLSDFFEDQAVKKIFWNLPLVKQISSLASGQDE